MKEPSDRIFFTQDVNNLLSTRFGGDLGDGTLLTYHAMYGKPDVKAGFMIEWEKYKTQYDNFNPSRIVLVGVNRMITPSNRCDFIHAQVTVLTPHIPKVVIDTSPFIGEPWRLYYHYQVANCFDGFGANYSYPIEGEWFKWFVRDLDECMFTPERLKDCVVHTCTDLPRLSSTFEFYTPGESDLEWYEEAKKFELGRFKAPKSFLLGLSRAANKHFGIKVTYDSYREDHPFKVPDVGVYRFLVEENRRRQEIYNLFTREKGR